MPSSRARPLDAGNTVEIKIGCTVGGLDFEAERTVAAEQEEEVD